MVSLTVECAEHESELLAAELWDQGATGIQEEPLPAGRCRLKAWFDDADGLLDYFDAWSPRLAHEADRDWEEETRQAWQPFPVGDRWWLAPDWDLSAAPAGRIRLTVHPGLALGTGAHPATQLCLRALETHLRLNDDVLDVGTGTGILASAAHLCGARRAIACDMDPDFVPITRTNTRADAIPALLFTGSTRALRDQCADVVVANINAVTHANLARDYTRIARRTLILSGYPKDDAATVETALTAEGWRVHETLIDSDWVCHVLCHDTH